MSARDTALRVLIECRRSGAWSDAALKQQLARDRLDRRDAALATRLCAAVLQNRLLLDEWIFRYFTGKRTALQPVV
ncbi:MAG: 16S rRNA (cytosine(967)-C(5))-methyltransferase RsmB, partial [Oscillospiraceae bacterium]|nr:16S rRNA (cytosine(967)-C(5))-methyltransferase RsmB [Oscillospiraceae bacterium]